MTIDLTRRTLLHLAGASSLTRGGRCRGAGGGHGGRRADLRQPDADADRHGEAAGAQTSTWSPITIATRSGLTVMARSMMGALLGAGGVPLLHLQRRERAAREARNAAGLYHTAFLMPTRKDLARWLVHAAANKVPLSGFADHLVSESVYLDDPEGNGIEVYADRAPETWKWDAGSVAMATDQLDIDGLLALTDTHTTNYAKAPDDLRIGHMHLRVGDLEQADRFYGGAIGFDPTRKRSGAAFLSSGRYHHHLGDQCLAERRRRPARRYGHRACVVFAGDRGGGDSAGPNAAPAAGERAGRGDRERHRDIGSLGHQGAAHQSLMLSAAVDQPSDRCCRRPKMRSAPPGASTTISSCRNPRSAASRRSSGSAPRQSP